MRMLELLVSGEFTIEEIDAMSGPVIGRPKSATFRTMDIAGLDVLGARRVAIWRSGSKPTRNLIAAFELPLFVRGTSIEREWIGEKAGQGFYKKAAKPSRTAGKPAKSDGTEDSDLGLPRRCQYRPRQPVHLAIARRCVVHRRCRLSA